LSGVLLFRFPMLIVTIGCMSYVFEQMRVPADRSRIDIADPMEVKWWSGFFGCSAPQLRDAVAAAGDSAAAVERLLDGAWRTGWKRDGAPAVAGWNTDRPA
jgi:hypothetical protein